MSHVLFTWELGAGLGHLVPMRSLAHCLIERGHEVTLALRDLSSAEKVFRGLPVRLLQAPHKISPMRSTYEHPVSFPQILHNIGFGEADELQGFFQAWHSIFELVRPDAVVFDHSPTALLAARGRQFRQAVTGLGFSYPPDTYPMGNMRPWNQVDQDWLVQTENHVTRSANQVLEQHDRAGLDRVGQLFSDVDAVLLQSYAELDHFGPRTNLQYLGIEWSALGAAPQWPRGQGPKIFAYLKWFPRVEPLLRQIAELHVPTIVCCPAITGSRREKFQQMFPRLRFESEPLHMQTVVAQCDACVHHGNHGTACAMLLGGKPLLMLPLQLEQRMLSRRVESLGAGLTLPPSDIHKVGDTLQQLFGAGVHSIAAQGFSQRYADHDPIAAIERACDWIAGNSD